MTVLVAGIAIIVTLLLGGLTVTIEHIFVDRERAQAAADAGALAAAAEASPYGTGSAEEVARSFAEANGAALVSCSCQDPSSIVVTTSIGSVTARSHAVFDAALMAPARGAAYDPGRLDPRVAAAVERLLDAARGRVHVVSGYRSPARQARLWAAALRKYGSPEAADDWVAPPGHSMHERGLAVDLGGDLALARRLVQTMGLPLHRPLPNEPWHFELIGARGGAGD